MFLVFVDWALKPEKDVFASKHLIIQHGMLTLDLFDLCLTFYKSFNW